MPSRPASPQGRTKILLIGINGQLGTDLNKVFSRSGAHVTGLSHAEIDVCEHQRMNEIIGDVQPEFVVNTSAYHKVEECEKQPAKAFEVNAIAPRELAAACKQYGSTLVHFSTDYVFGGRKSEGVPFKEDTPPAPLNAYGVSKLAGEHMIAYTADRYFIIRTCGLYGLAGSSGKGGNFVETMLRKATAGESVRVVSDEVLTPTFTEDLAAKTWEIMQQKIYGLYHVSAEGQCSWFEFTQKIYELENLKVDLRPMTAAEFPRPVRRPGFSVLKKARLKEAGIHPMPPWEDGLSRYLQARKHKIPQ